MIARLEEVGAAITLYNVKTFVGFRDSFPRSCEVIWKRLPVLIVFPFLMCGAGSAQNLGSTDSPAGETAPDAPKQLPGLNDPSVAGAPVDLATYVIGPNDILNIEVFREKDLSRPYPVRPDGIISIPLVGEMKAAGLTPMQLTRQLTEALSTNYKDPIVTITVWEVRSKKFAVTGEVKRPNTYPLIGKITVFDAINEAGGFADVFANQTDIQIIRGKDRFKFNYKDYVRGKNTDKNIVLENGDVVYVK